MSNLPNPYVGPRSFNTGEALYGRDRELRTLTALLIAERIVLLHSPSGAGKTSLVKAGLLPQLKEENFNILPIVRVNIEPPPDYAWANRYLLSTFASLEEGFPANERLPLVELAKFSLNDYLNQRAQQKDTLIIFDQFEEILTVAPEDRDGKLAFFNELGQALRNKQRWALFSMREDYLGAITPYVRPIPNRLVTRFRLDLLGNEAAMQAMQKPAKTAGVTITTSAAQKLLDDLRTIQVQMPDGSIEKQLGLYIEPVHLQVVCYRMWEKRAPNGDEIDEKNLDGVGNVNDSLADYYATSIGRVSQSSSTPERSIREWFGKKLISPEGIRGQVRKGTETCDGLPNADVDKLVNTHIIRAEQRGQIWIELSHDRMIEPVRESNRKWFDANLCLFQRRATLWAEQGRGEGLLLRGAELQTAEQDSKQIELTTDESAYLDACQVLKKRTLRDQNQKRWIVAGLICSIMLFFVALYYSITATNANQGYINQKQTAQAASTHAIAEKLKAYYASTEAVNQQILAQQASKDAQAQQVMAQIAKNTAVASANNAATAEAVAKQQRDKANEQELRALEQQKIAEANALVAQSILEQNQGNVALANLLAVAAFEMQDNSGTRIRMLNSVANSDRLYLTKTINPGISPEIAFGTDYSSLVSDFFSNCKEDNTSFCPTSGVVKLWKISGTTNTPFSINQDANSVSLNGPMLDAIAVSPDGLTLAVAGCDPVNSDITVCEKEDITLLDLKTRQQVGEKISLTGITISNQKSVGLAYSPDGKILALSINTSNKFSANPATTPAIILWKIKDNQKIGPINLQNGATQMVFSPDGKTLAVASDGGLILMDTTSMDGVSQPNQQKIGSAAIWSLAYSPDGKILALGNNNKTITMLDTNTYKVIGQPLLLSSSLKQDPNSIAVALAFSPDGKILASGHKYGVIVLWNVIDQSKLVGPLYNHISPGKDNYPVFRVTFSPDGKTLATSSNEIIIWDMDKASWVSKACALAGRDFTQAEWQQFFGEQPIRKVCGK